MDGLYTFLQILLVLANLNNLSSNSTNTSSTDIAPTTDDTNHTSAISSTLSANIKTSSDTSISTPSSTTASKTSSNASTTASLSTSTDMASTNTRSASTSSNTNTSLIGKNEITTTPTASITTSETVPVDKCHSHRMSLSLDLQMHSMHNVSQFNDLCKKINPSTSSPRDDNVCVMTAANSYVSMITSCKQGLKENIIRKYCEADNPINSSIWFNVPVNKNDITYKNIFCMFCQEENLTSSDWNLWDLGFSCVNKSTGLPVEIQGAVNYSDLKPYNSGHWIYDHADEKSVCFLHPKIDAHSNYSRCCQDDCKNKTQCYEDNSDIIADFVIVSKNQSCEPHQTPVNFNIDLKLQIDMMPPLPSCEKIPEIYKKIICSQPTNHPWADPKECLYNQFINVENVTIEFEDKNRTLLVVSLKRKFMQTDWFFINSTTIHLCQGHEIKDKEEIGESWFTLMFLKATMVTILIFLIYFYWLPEKSLWDKILAAFGTALVIQLYSVVHDPRWLGETMPTRMWNYSLLSCSIWILILFYDYRASLHKSRRVYVGPHATNKTFLCYLLLNAVIVLLVAVLSYSYGSPKSGSPKHENLLLNSPMEAFWVSAILFGVSCCILTETIDKLYRNHQLYSSRQHLNLPASWILAMAFTWMIVSLILLYPPLSAMSNGLLYILHTTQAVLYIVFTYFEIKERVKRKLDYFLLGKGNGEQHFWQFQNVDDRTPIVTIQTIQIREEPRRTDNATFYAGKL